MMFAALQTNLSADDFLPYTLIFFHSTLQFSAAMPPTITLYLYFCYAFFQMIEFPLLALLSTFLNQDNFFQVQFSTLAVVFGSRRFGEFFYWQHFELWYAFANIFSFFLLVVSCSAEKHEILPHHPECRNGIELSILCDSTFFHILSSVNLLILSSRFQNRIHHRSSLSMNVGSFALAWMEIFYPLLQDHLYTYYNYNLINKTQGIM